MALRPNALVTLADGLAEMSLTTDSGGAVDRRMWRYINAASQAIATYCHRKFERATVVAERYPAAGGPRLALKRIPIVSLTSIVIDEATIDSTEYTIEDYDAGLVYMRSRLPWQGMRRSGIAQDIQPGTEEPDVIATYDGGFVTGPQAAAGGAYAGQPITLPADLEQACLELVATYAGSQGAAGAIVSESIGDASVAYRLEGVTETEAGIPKHVRGKLNKYKRPVIV